MAASASFAAMKLASVSAGMSMSSLLKPGIRILDDRISISADRVASIGWGRNWIGRLGLPRTSTFAILRPRNQESRDAIQIRPVSLVGWPQGSAELGRGVDGDDKQEKASEEVQLIERVRSMLKAMGDGEINASAYDTAWVALVEKIHGDGSPQFPSCLDWIAENQLADGSWGDPHIFSAHDRVINTLACVIALKTWNHCPRIWQQGISFLRANMGKLGEEDLEHMPIGFEVAFPSLLEIAKAKGIDLSYDSPVLHKIYEQRQLKLKRIPKEVLQKFPTTLLHSLEGMTDLDWEKIIKLQCEDGSLLFSPSSTAFALMQTKNENCLRYLTRIVERFNGGVPNVYPVDLFEHLWAVDRLERLGVARHFELEIKDCLDYVYRYWTDSGICWARNSEVHDVDDTAVGFRLLRLHGYEVSADVFRHFEKDGEFFCFAGQSNQAITGIYNLNRASQVMFPGEKILEDAKIFSYKFLRQKQKNSQLLDKWIITKDLPGEVEYALDFPFYASLPRVETRYYLDQYGGEDDVWIGKTLYRMPYVNNNTYLELAKLEFNQIQSVHRSELRDVLRWYKECQLEDYGVTKIALLDSYFLAASVIFQPERTPERLAWAKSAVLMEAIAKYLDQDRGSEHQISGFIDEFERYDGKTTSSLVNTLIETLNMLSLEALVAHGRDINNNLYHAWLGWMMSWRLVGEGDGDAGSNDAELLVATVNLCGGRCTTPQQRRTLSHPHYAHLAKLANSICNQLHRIPKHKVQGTAKEAEDRQLIDGQIDSQMRELIQFVLQNSQELEKSIMQTFLDVTKTFYYRASCPPEMTKRHISKVLFHGVA